MKIVAVSTVRNEADIIELFVRYHLQIVDHMIIINHRSIDSTGDILANLQKEGLQIEVIENRSLRQPQKSALNMALKKAVTDYDADWVLPLDADEFLSTNKEQKVTDIISSFSGDTVMNIPWHSYIPLESDNTNESNTLKRIQHCKKRESIQTYKALIPKIMAKKRQGVLGFGSHHYKGRHFYIGSRFKSTPTDELFLAHYPIRDAKQVKVKAIMGWLSVLAKPDKGAVENHHLKKLYDNFKNGHEITMGEVTEMAYSSHSDDTFQSSDENLIYAPVIPQHGDIELLHASVNRCEPVELLWKMAEEYAAAVSTIQSNI